MMITKSKLITNEHPLLVAPQLAATLHSVDAAIVLQQIHYWLTGESGRVIDGVRWIYNRLDDWLEQFPWLSKWKLRQAMTILRDEFKVVIFAQHEVKEWKRRGWYTIDYGILESLHTSTCEGSNSQELVEPPFVVCNAHTTESKTSSENSQRKQQQSDADFKKNSALLRPVQKSDAPLMDETELIEEEFEDIGEDRFPVAPPTDSIEENRQILAEVRAGGIALSPELQRLVLKSSVDVVRDALAVLLEKKQKGANISNPSGYLTRAIQGEWKPTLGKDAEKCKPGIPDEIRPPSIEQMATIEECKAKGTIKDYYLSDDGICKIVLPNGIHILPWWEFLKV